MCDGRFGRKGSLTSGALDLEDTLLTSILLEGTDKRGRDWVDDPLAISGRPCIPRRGWCIHHCLITFRYRGAIGGEIERSHDFPADRRGEGRESSSSFRCVHVGGGVCFFCYNICISCSVSTKQVKALMVQHRFHRIDRRGSWRTCKHRVKGIGWGWEFSKMKISPQKK